MEYDRGIFLLGVIEIPHTPSSNADADLIASHLGPKYVVPTGIAAPANSDVTTTCFIPETITRPSPGLQKRRSQPSLQTEVSLCPSGSGVC